MGLKNDEAVVAWAGDEQRMPTSAARRWAKRLQRGGVALVLGSMASTAGAAAYTFTQLPSLGGTYVYGSGLNNAGQVATRPKFGAIGALISERCQGVSFVPA